MEQSDSSTGRHRADTTPQPPHRVAVTPHGRHQESDLDPRRWPWLVLVLSCTVLAAGGGYAWGHGAGTADQREAEVARTVQESPGLLLCP